MVVKRFRLAVSVLVLFTLVLPVLPLIAPVSGIAEENVYYPAVANILGGDILGVDCLI